MRRSAIATLFARSPHDLSACSNLFDGFLGFGGRPGRSGTHASLPARCAGAALVALTALALPNSPAFANTLVVENTFWLLLPDDGCSLKEAIRNIKDGAMLAPM